MEQKYIDDILSALTSYPTLAFRNENNSSEIVGRWDVSFDGQVFESYDIRIAFDSNYPTSLPKVFETSNKIKRDPDMHLNPSDWSACLFVSHQRWEIYPSGSSFKTFLEIPVHNFFLGQAHYAAHGYWPNHRERGHGNKGIAEYYKEKFQTDDIALIFRLLLEAKNSHSSRQKKCPCNNKTPMRNCHGDIVKKIREHQDPELLNDAILLFDKLRNIPNKKQNLRQT
jgi:hypothetical protein